MVVESAAVVFAKGLTQAVHLGFSIPEKSRQGALRPKGVDLRVGWHLEMIDTVDKLTPSDDLTDKTLGGGEGNLSAAEGPFSSSCALEGIEQSDIEHR